MLINSGEDFVIQDVHKINSNSSLYRKGIEPLSKIDWHLDLRAQKDISRCNSSLVLIDPPLEKSIEQILNHIGDELMRNGILDSKQELVESLQTGDEHKLNRWIDVDNFLVLSTPLHELKTYHYVLCNLGEPTDIGLSDSISFVTLIIGKEQIKESKSVHQVASTFANAYLDPQLRHDLLEAKNIEESKESFEKFKSRELSREFHGESSSNIHDVIPNHAKPFLFGCLIRDYQKRLPVYISDWTDGFRSKYAIGKTMSATFFLYTACLLPAIAFGVLNSINTNGEMTIAKHFLAQGLGGIIFSMVSGQPLVILLATAPLSIFIKLTHSIAVENSLDFWHFYALIGIFNACFLIIYSITGATTMMKYSSPFVEETFALFITIAFLYDGGREIDSNLQLAIVFMTLWICYQLSNFKETVFFKLKFRELISDYALPVGVLISSALTYAFRVNETDNNVGTPNDLFHIMNLNNDFPIWAYFAALGIGFLLSLLFFVDQNISCMLASAPKHNLKKWTGFHADLMATALINILLSVLGLPWIHGAIPHSALHVRALALLQKTIKNGVFEERFLQVQETRAAAFLSQALLLVSLLMLPTPLKYIPNAVLYGVFWYLGVKALVGNQFWNRVLLLITDQHCFPPSIVDRQVLQKEVHKFTAVQIVCLGVFCFVSFFPNPYMTAIFPFLVVLLIPIRKLVLPRLFTRRALELLDGY